MNRLLAAVVLVGLCFGVATAEVWHGCALAPNVLDAWVVAIETTLVYHSPDFGANWSQQAFPTNRDFFDVFFLDSLNGWACGTLAEVQHTTDGGQTWNWQGFGASKFFTRVQFLDRTHGWAAGGSAIMGRWDEAGATWQQIILPYPDFIADTCDFYGISFVDTLHGWMCAGRYPAEDTFIGGQGYIAATSDGGFTWVRQLRDTTYDYFDLRFVNRDTGWVVGGNDRTMRAYIAKTTNRGLTWTGAVIGTAGMLRAVDFVDGRYGWAVGKFGTVLRTTDGGTTWSAQSSGVDSTLFDVDFTDRLHGVASGFDGIIFTSDGGATWHRSYIGPHVTGWVRTADLPIGAKNKNVKDGGALAYGKEGVGALGSGFGDDTGYVYAFKGNNRCEFYRYNTITGDWVAKESIPALNRNMKKKGVKKGSSLAYGTNGKIYATKGSNILDLWQYDPAIGVWTQKADVPTGAKACKEGVGAVAVKEGTVNYIYLLKGSGTCEFYRFNADANAWDVTLPTAPDGLSGKPYKNGSCLAYDNGDTIYCLKGSYNELAAYSIAGKNWVNKSPLPLIAPPGTKKKKVKDGAGMAYYSQAVFALKGGNTDEFWIFSATDQLWHLQSPLTTGSKRVKGGGALTFADGDKSLYAFRGNNTREYWKYGPIGTFSYIPGTGNELKNIQGNSSFVTRHSSLSVTPNPFTSSLKPSISYSLPVAGNVNLKLYDITGKLVRVVAGGYAEAGRYSLGISDFGLGASRLGRGIYLLRIDAEGASTTCKLVRE